MQIDWRDDEIAHKAGQKLNETQWNRIWEAEPSKSVEHIKPQSSGVSYMHHLGNLMMLPPGVNSKLKDSDPATKVETYKTCGLLSSIEVAKLIAKGRWDKGAVEARASELLAWAKTQ
ncbi:MAG: HNH endonuclease family protein, partial [Xanthobacteraceae bacterium]